MNAIEIKNLTKQYSRFGKKTEVVSDLSLSIAAGEVFGFLGPNGAGKTTTIKMLVGLSRPDKGEIKILGGYPGSFSVREKIGFMPETPAFYSYLTGYEFLSFVGDIFGLATDIKKQRILTLLGEVDLLDAKDLQVRKYSKGMTQRLGLAQALVNDPEVVFLDEPLDGLDPLGRADTKKLLLALKKRGKTIFFNSHILSDVEDICDVVGIIDKGKLVTYGSVEDVSAGEGRLEEAFVRIITVFRASVSDKKTYVS